MAEKSKLPIHPSPGYCVVIPYIEKSQGGFVRPDSEKEKEGQSKGTVLIVEGAQYQSEYGANVPKPPFVKVGVIIIHKRYGHEDITINNTKYRLVKFSDIVGELLP